METGELLYGRQAGRDDRHVTVQAGSVRFAEERALPIDAKRMAIGETVAPERLSG
jgi:hypothetical protein